MKLKYRPEIDGLRAVAVGAVILYHAQITIFGFQIFPGGFIGVDIFFVISGYLITSIILKELITTGSFSFKNFYERRIRRILPALLLVMLASLYFAWIYLLPRDLINFSKSILYSLGFISNLYFYYSGQQYGDEDGLLKPFLHTWSLSVEEQYYILFPIILLITFKYFKKYLINILIIGFIISLGLADYGSRNYANGAFYLLPTRMWELLAGSIIAYFEITLGHRSKHQTLRIILPGAGILLIGYSFLFLNDKIFHPFNTLYPIIGVSLVIWHSNTNEIFTRMLSSKLFVGIGLISYSLYLWHYPVFAFARINNFTQEAVFKKLIIVFIIFFLSTITYYIVERPARNKIYRFKIISIFLIISFFILFIFNFNVILKKGYENRSKETQIDTAYEFQGDFTFNYLKNNSGKVCFNNNEICKFNSDKKKKILLIGDSHFGSISYNLESRVEKYNFIPITSEGYFYFDNTNIVSINNKTKQINDQTKKFNFIVDQELKESKNNIIIFGGSTSLYFYKKRFLNEKNHWDWEFVDANFLKHNPKLLEQVFYNQLKKLTKNNYVILIYPIPEMGNNFFKNIKSLKSSKYTFDDYKRINNEIIDYFDKIDLNNLIKIKPSDVLCDELNNLCPLVDYRNKKLIYSDSLHTSLTGSELINNLIIKEIEKIELKSIQ